MAGMFGNDAGTNTAASNAAFKKGLSKVYTWYTGGFLAFVVVLAVLEQMGCPRQWIGLIFLLATIGLYAGIGIMSRTTDAAEYYVAGRRVPAVYKAWQPAPTGCPPLPSSVWPYALPDGLQRPGFYHGLDRRFTVWSRCFLRPTCAVRPVHDPDFLVNVTAATCRVSSVSSRRFCAPSPMWWHRFTASASSPRA